MAGTGRAKTKTSPYLWRKSRMHVRSYLDARDCFLASALPSKRMRTARLLPGRGRRCHLARRK
eukprot:scaffold21070_cov107-Isochrysis_galbana.AAC.4